MKKNEYYNRLIDEELLFQLSASGAVLIEGAKWCGKTSSGEHCAKSVIYMQDASALWNAVRFTIDQRGECGQFICQSAL